MLILICSERQRLGLAEDWEELHISYMGEYLEDGAGSILEWIAPKARKQFLARLEADKHAVPLFMNEGVREHYRHLYLDKAGLAETLRGKWNTFPDCSDRRHYMYDVPRANTHPSESWHAAYSIDQGAMEQGGRLAQQPVAYSSLRLVTASRMQ